MSIVVVRMDMKKPRTYGIICLVLLGLCGHLVYACEPDEQSDDMIEDQDLSTEITTEDTYSSACQQSSDLLEEYWLYSFLTFLERLFNQYPIIKELLIMIFS